VTRGRAIGGPADGMILEFPPDRAYVAVVEGEALVLPDPSCIRVRRDMLSKAWAAHVRWELYVSEPLTVIPFLPHYSHRARLVVDRS
jgi:hypothetical protein